MDERIVKILHHPATIPAVVGVFSFGAGFGAGVLFNKRTKKVSHDIPSNLELDLSETDLEIIEESSIEVVSETDDDDEESEDDIPPENARAREFIETVLKRDDISLEIEVEEPDEDVAPVLVNGEVVTRRHIFAEAVEDDDWDYETELRNRSDEEPYILHADEFHEQQKGYGQTSVVYYAGDDILVAEDGTPVYNFRQILGELNFGHGSGDPNICFIRNDKRRAEYEVIKDSGMYSHVLLGLEIENNERVEDLKHSTGPMKFRGD